MQMTKQARQLTSASRNNMGNSYPTQSWTTMSFIAQWLEGSNRARPCRLLSSIDTKILLTWLGQKQGLTSYVKSCPYIEWKDVNQETWVIMRPLQKEPTNGTTVTRRVIVSPPVTPHRPKVLDRLQDNPTDRTTADSTEARLDTNLVDWCLTYRHTSTPFLIDDPDKMQWLKKFSSCTRTEGDLPPSPHRALRTAPASTCLLHAAVVLLAEIPPPLPLLHFE